MSYKGNDETPFDESSISLTKCNEKESVIAAKDDGQNVEVIVGTIDKELNTDNTVVDNWDKDLELENPKDNVNGKNVNDVKITDTEAAITKQIYYYFSDINLSRDKFLQDQQKLDCGWITLKTLLTFKRIAALTDSADVIVNALQKSNNKLIEIHSDKSKIRRNPEKELPELEELRKECILRSVYVKGFKHSKSETGEISEILKFFEQFDKVENVVMRRYQNKGTKEYIFKGSCFATFETREQGERFIKLDKVEYNGMPLERKWQTEYYESKKIERSNRDKEKSKKTEQDQEIKLPLGTVIKMDGFSEDTTRELIKEAITKLGGDVAFVDFSRGDKSGHARLIFENSAAAVLQKLENPAKMQIDNVDINVSVLEGDEEKQFLEKVCENMKSKRSQNKSKGSRHQHQHSSNNNNKNQRKRKGGSLNDEEPKIKKDIEH